MMISEIRELSAFSLSADCPDIVSPDTMDSSGAVFLTDVRDAIVDAWELGEFDEGDDHDTIAELSDGAPSVYTHELWEQFVDLAAYRVDISELWGGALEDAPGLALYLVAERLGHHLLGLLREDYDDGE